MSPDQAARGKVRTWVTSQWKLCASRVSSQWKSTLSAGRVRQRSTAFSISSQIRNFDVGEMKRTRAKVRNKPLR
jgi:hypothetical protein